VANLQLSNSEIVRNVLMESGLGRDITSFVNDPATAEDVRNIIRSGLRRAFLPIDNGVPYRWRFLRKHAPFSIVPVYSTGTLTKTSGSGNVTLAGGTWPAYAIDMFIRVNGHVLFINTRTSDSVVIVENTQIAVTAGTAFEAFRYRYPMPTDFAEWDGGVVYSISSGETTTASSHFLAEADEADLRMRYHIGWNEDSETKHFAVSATYEGDGGFNIMFWPVPEPDAHIQGVYHSIPVDNLPADMTAPGSDVVQVPPMYAEAFMEAILAAAEAYNHNAMDVHEQRFQAAIAAAIAHDRAAAGAFDFSNSPGGRRGCYGEDGMGCAPPIGLEIDFWQ